MSKTVARGPRITAAWLSAQPLRKVFAAFDAAQTAVRVVGGAVRNSLIEQPVVDVDLATPAVPDDVMRIAKDAGLGAHPTGIDHGTITVVADGSGFEVTTLRRDIETDGRHAKVAFTQSWDEDAGRRDFTINALYCDADGTIYDPLGGLDDLRRRRVRFIGEAKARIHEDNLRILRFFRFSAEYGKGALDPIGLAAAVASKRGLVTLAAERVHSELLKLLAAPFATEIVRTMDESGILGLVIPGARDPEQLARLRLIETSLGQPHDEICGLAALAVAEPSMAGGVARKLRLSNAQAADLERAAIVNADLSPERSDTLARVAIYRLGAKAFRRAVLVSWARSGASASDPGWRKRMLLTDRWRAPKPPFGGSDVIALGVPSGPAVGNVLRAFEAWWIAGDFVADRAAQLAKLKEIAAHTVQ